MECIPFDQVTFHPHSYADPAGRVFLWKGQLYRGIRSEWAPFFRRLLQSGVLKELVDHGLLIDTEPTALTIDGFEMVVRHRYVPFTSYPEEWCGAMLRDAALTILDLVAELAKHDLSLKDGQPWNLLFDAGRFVYVDVSSIIPARGADDWPGYDAFCRFCLYPLRLMSQGQERIARRLLPEREGVRKSDFAVLTRRSDGGLASHRSMMNGIRSAVRTRLVTPARRLLDKGSTPLRSVLRKQSPPQHAQLGSLSKVRREIESLSFPDAGPESWHHGRDSVPTPASQHDWTPKQREVYKVLMDLQPGSVLDIRSGTGWYTRLAALLTNRVVSFEADPARVTQLYYEIREHKLPILPLLMEFTDPTPARGLFGHWAIAATDRFQCDMVLALDLVQQTVRNSRLDFEHIVGGLALFTKRWLVVEFVPPENDGVSRSCSDAFSWYTLENFVTTARRRFRHVRIMPTHPEKGVLLVCEK